MSVSASKLGPVGRPPTRMVRSNAGEPRLSLIEFQPRPRVVFGVGSLARLGALVREYGGNRVLLVTDPGIVRAGHAARAESVMKTAGVEVSIFDQVAENPTTQVADDCAAVARLERIDFLVGLGGGSSMDTAKGCNFLLSGGGRMEDYWGAGKATHPMRPMIAVPTTAGTGSECQSFALISKAETHVKMACGDPKATPVVAILDPSLTVTQPRAVTAATGIDALAHAIESAVKARRNPFSQMFSREAFRLCAGGLRQVLSQPNDLEARGQMLLGAALAGMAIENSMLGAAHAAANPLSARYGVVHGQAVGLMLPAVVRFNAADAEARSIYQRLAEDAGLVGPADDPARAVAALVEFIEDYLDLAELPCALDRFGVREADLKTLSDEAAQQWTAGFNPRAVSPADFLHLYQSVLHNGSLPQSRGRR